MSQLSADDRLAIREIIATYCHALDLGRWDEFVKVSGRWRLRVRRALLDQPA